VNQINGLSRIDDWQVHF